MSGTILSGPAFEPSVSRFWKSTDGKDGAHYNTFHCKKSDGMEALRKFFPSGLANEMNLVVFSTSGVHGKYGTIEEAEAEMDRGGKNEDGESITPSVTFLVIQPRLVCLRYGNCEPKNSSDIDFLKTLRKSSWDEFKKIGSAR